MRCKDIYNRIHNIDLNQVVYFFAEGNCIYLKTLNNEFEVLEDVSLELLSKNYQTIGFLRISKSVVVNISHVNRTIVHSNYRFRLVMTNKERLTVNRSYRKKFSLYLKK